MKVIIRKMEYAKRQPEFSVWITDASGGTQKEAA
jgi:hypothetical protein